AAGAGKQAVKPKYGRRLVAGGALGLVAGVAACWALLYFDVLPPGVVRSLGLTKASGGATGLGLAKIYLASGQFQRAIETVGGAEEPEAKAVRGEARWLLYMQDQKKANKKYDRKDLEAAFEDLNAAKDSSKDSRVLLFLGHIEETLNNPEKAR